MASSSPPLLKNLELDKICRVCLQVKKEMRPLFCEMIVEMLMDCTRVQIDNTDGWPDKICVQCVQQVSRFHSFKARVEKQDQQLRNYIKGLTVIVEEPQIPKAISFHHIGLPQHITQQPYIANGLHSPQMFNAGQIVTTQFGQQVQIQPNGNLSSYLPIQMMQSGQPQMVEFQRTSEDSCEIIVQPPDSPSSEIFTERIYAEQMQEVDDSQSLVEEVDEEEVVEELQEIHESYEIDDEEVEEGDEYQETETDERTDYIIIPLKEPEESTKIEVEVEEEQQQSETEESEDKEFVDMFINMQTACLDGHYICNLCRKEFKFAKSLQTHMKKHSNWIKANCKKQPQCEICLKSFKGPGMLKMHMKTHEIRTLHCAHCKKSFQSHYHLRTHLTKHEIKSDKFKCDPCQDIFISANDLRMHRRKQHKGKGCDKAVTRQPKEKHDIKIQTRMKTNA